MISDFCCNGQLNPVNIDRTVVLRWRTDFCMTEFTVRIFIGDKNVYERHIMDSICLFVYDRPLLPCTWYTCLIECYGEDGRRENSKLQFRTALSNGFPAQSKWIGGEPIKIENQNIFGNPATYLLREINIDCVKQTYVHIAGLGLFVLYINGKRVSDDVLNCPFTNYDKSILYATYEITEYLKQGENHFCVVLGDGWYNQTAPDEWGFYKAKWRQNSKLLLYVEGGLVLYSDERWRYSDNGPINSSAIRLGERVDFKQRENIVEKPIHILPSPLGRLKSMQEFPIREVEILSCKNVQRKENCLLLDFENSITGYLKLYRKTEGKTQVLYGDKLGENGRIDNSSNAQYVYAPNYQMDTVVWDGKERVYNPLFTYHSFRYVEIESEKLLSDLKAEAVFIRSDFKKVGSFSCSNSRLNKLFEISLRSLECNYTGFPTDCPHREKNGWTGDMQLSCSAYLNNYDMSVNLYKWIEDIIEAQREDGCIPCIVPTAGWGYTWGNGPAWDFALFELPYRLYIQRGETYAIKLAYAACESYLNFLKNQERDNLIELGLGDWNYPKYISLKLCPLMLISSCFYCEMFSYFSLFSRIMGKKSASEYSKNKSEKIRGAIYKKFVLGKSQDDFGITELAAILYFNIVEGKEYQDKLNFLIKRIQENRYRAAFGILGAKFVHNVLCANDRTDIFIKMMECDEYPSFGNWLKQGATTLWEDFEGINSRNHHMFSDIASVMQSYILGVRTAFLGNKTELIIKPYFAEFSNLSGAVATVNGMVRVSYCRKGEHVEVSAEVPYGIDARLFFEDKEYLLKGGQNFLVI